MGGLQRTRLLVHQLRRKSNTELYDGYNAECGKTKSILQTQESCRDEELVYCSFGTFVVELNNSYVGSDCCVYVVMRSKPKAFQFIFFFFYVVTNQIRRVLMILRFKFPVLFCVPIVCILSKRFFRIIYSQG